LAQGQLQGSKQHHIGGIQTSLQLTKQLLQEMPLERPSSHRHLGASVAEVSKLPTLLERCSRTNMAARAFLKGSQADSLSTRSAFENRKNLAKRCVWDATPSVKSVCQGEDLVKCIQHLKINNEAEKGLSLTEVCRISMRTRELLARQLQWLDSAMAELHVQAETAGCVTRAEFVSVLRSFIGDVLDDEDLHMLFERLDGENKGYLILQLSEGEREKAEELKRMKKAATAVTKVNRAISAMAQPQLCSSSALTEGVESHTEGIESRTDHIHGPSAQRGSGKIESPCLQPQHPEEIEQEEVELELRRDDFVSLEDVELQELEHRLEKLRSAKAERMRARRKRELQVEIEALERELAAKTPKGLTPHASTSSSDRPSHVSFALPTTLSS